MTGRRPDAPLGLAFLGCGAATRMHSRTLARLRAPVLRYYASRDPARARAFARELGGAGTFESYDAALADPRVDAVLVATPPALHLAHTLAALEAGKHAIVEKPAFLRATDFDTVAAAAAAAGRQVLVAENYFYKPLAERLRAALAAGLVGDVLFVQVNAVKHQPATGWRGDPALAGGGALFEGGIHWLNLVANLGLTLVSATGVRPGRGAGPDRSMLVVLRYAEGAAGTLAYSWEVPSPLRGLRISRIYGTKGSIAFESNGLFLYVHGTARRLVFPDLRDIAGYRAMFTDFLDALRTGRPPRFTLDRAREDVARAEEIYRSLRQDEDRPEPRRNTLSPADAHSQREGGA